MGESPDADLDSDPTEAELSIEAENIALAEEKWNAEEAELDLHSEMDKKQDSWSWMKEKKYVTMFKEIAVSYTHLTLPTKA